MSEDALTVAAQIPAALRPVVADKLRELGPPAERLHLRGEDPASVLRALTVTIKEML